MLELQVRLYKLLDDHRINNQNQNLFTRQMTNVEIGPILAKTEKNVKYFRVLRIISSVKRFILSTTK